MLKTWVLSMLSMLLATIGDDKGSPIVPKKIDNIDNIDKTRVLSTFLGGAT